jgi:lipopolysaccharide export system permease protein
MAFGVIAFAILGFPRTTRQSRAVSMFAVIAAVSVLRLGGFAGTAIAVTTPAVLAVVYTMIVVATGLGGYVIWRGIPIDLDEKLNFGVAARAGLLRLEHIAARFNIRLPTRDILRRLGNSD